MRLWPVVTEQEAEQWLTRQARRIFGAEQVPGLAADISKIAAAMAAVSTVRLDDGITPWTPGPWSPLI